MRTISFKVSESLFNQITQLMKQQRVQKSEWIRDILLDYIEKNTQSSKPRSFLELTEDLCGVFSGSADLSTNKKHLKGYGE